MANLYAYMPFHLPTINFYWYFANYYDSGIVEDADIFFSDHLYPDLVWLQGMDSSDYLELDLLGSNITSDLFGNVTGGTVNAIAELEVLTSGLRWFIEEISVSAVALYNSWQTPSTLDELALLQSALSGDDSIYLSDYSDTMLSYGGNDVVYGFDGDDTIDAGAGDDIVDGGFGYDWLYGGTGHDTFYVDELDDIVFEYAGEGIDLVIASTSFYLDDHVEDLWLELGAGDIFGEGNWLDNFIDGNEGANLLLGWDGDDTIYGWDGDDTIDAGAGDDIVDGEFGYDWLFGGTGHDTFYADESDIVFEYAGEGIDLVIASTSFYLYDHIEDLWLELGAGDIFGSGNGLDNIIEGNEGANLLLGWDGNDTIYGWDGNDVIYGVNGSDTLYGEAGIDVLIAGESSDTLDGGNDPDELHGENGNDILYGGTGFHTDILVGGNGNDTLDGSASIASGETRNEGDYDRLYGGIGDDIYDVDTPADLTFEFGNLAEGNDTVYADIVGGGYYLYGSVENLILLDITPFGVGNELGNALTGSTITNWLLGGAGNDTLNGKGGDDVLFGEAGSDTFTFETGTGGDLIGDFVKGADKIQLTGTGFDSFAELTANGNLFENGGSSVINLGAGDFIVVSGVTGLAASDFVFI